MRVLVLGAGLAGLAATERLLDAGASVTVIDSFPLPGGRTASFEVPVEVAGFIPGDIVEHGLHAWFQHYHELFALMERAGVRRPPFSGQGVYFWSPGQGHYVIEGRPFLWLVNALRLPEHLRGSRAQALVAFTRLIRDVESALRLAERTDRESALAVLCRAGVPDEAIRNVFRPCLYSLTSLPLEQLSALEMLRWMSSIIPDPRIRCLQGGGTQAMAAPIADYLKERGAEFRLGVEVRRLWLDASGRMQCDLEQAPDRTGVRHILVQGFAPAEVPDVKAFDAIVCTLPWERLLALSHGHGRLMQHPVWSRLARLENIHPLSIRLWFEKPIEGAREHYILSSGTVFDVLRPTHEHSRYPHIQLVDALVEDIDTTLPELGYDHERLLGDGATEQSVLCRVLDDLERLYPGQIRGNRVVRRYLHTREGIVACRPGAWENRAPQHVGIDNFVLGGDWTRHPFGVCMEGAVRSGQFAAEALLKGQQPVVKHSHYDQLAYSAKTLFQST